SETYKQVSDCLSSEGSVNRSLSDLHCGLSTGALIFFPIFLGFVLAKTYLIPESYFLLTLSD
ncbi:hypothetical protein M2G48_10970, partial [Vibrio vulnificus]|nr:hypothetical protein [Vibrio vulnificus]